MAIVAIFAYWLAGPVPPDVLYAIHITPVKEVPIGEYVVPIIAIDDPDVGQHCTPLIGSVEAEGTLPEPVGSFPPTLTLAGP